MAQLSKRARQKGKAFRLLEWESVRRDLKRGQRPPSGDRTMGIVTYGFRKGFPKYIYQLRMTLGRFNRWITAPSRGAVYNKTIKRG